MCSSDLAVPLPRPVRERVVQIGPQQPASARQGPVHDFAQEGRRQVQEFFRGVGDEPAEDLKQEEGHAGGAEGSVPKGWVLLRCRSKQIAAAPGSRAGRGLAFDFREETK